MTGRPKTTEEHQAYVRSIRAVILLGLIALLFAGIASNEDDNQAYRDCLRRNIYNTSLCD